MNAGTKFFAVLGLACATAIAPKSAEAQDWEWVIAPYIFAADISAELALNGDPAAGADVTFSDLVDKLNSGFMGHFEGRKGQWGLYFDMIYMDVSDQSVISPGPGGPILEDITTDAGLKMGLYDLAGIYRIGEPAAGSAVFDFILGARIVDIDMSATASIEGPPPDSAGIEFAPSETDLLFGGRIVGLINDRWHYKLLADFSIGGTDGTFNTLAAIGYTFGQSGLFSLDLGYRYMTVKMSTISNVGLPPEGIPAEMDMTFSGPIAGFIFTF